MLRHRKQLTFYRICLLLLPITIQGQLFNEFKNRELSDHFFGLSYFPASWQSSVFEEDLYTSSSYQHEVQFSKLSNALRLNYSGAEKMLSQFKEDFPSSIAARTIDLDVANYYFQNEKYRYALKWYQKISENEVPKKDRPLYNFNKGYTLFSAKNYKKAKPYLEKVKDHKTYESDAHYFLGHIAYQLEDFDSALTSFSSISNPIQKENLLYFQADMNFRLGRFDQAITLSKEALKQANNEEASELSKIIGESYFNLQSYSDAIPFLEAYEGKKGTWENSDYYQLGYAYFKQQNFDKAIGQFNRIIGNKNEMAQNAYYALAECYLNTNQKSAALNAFKSASAMNFNPIIKEDAFLNYAKLSHEIGNPYEASSKVLVAFLETYPKNEHVILIEKLLIESYTKSKNYSAALEILENNSGFKNNETLQRVLILSAIQEYQKGSYAKASALFQRGLKLKENKTLEAFGLYWYGRSEYERNLFDNALDLFKQFRSHPKKENVEAAIQLNYDLGYVYFKLGKYQDALRSFEAFNEKNSALDVSYQRDTFLRMGDCQFALKKYWPAMEHYNTSIAFAPQKGAYASFQKAISYGFVDRNPKKIEALNTFILQYPNDPLVDDVLFELASAYSSTSDAQQAIDTYDRLLTRFENSPYLAKAALNKGLILFNQEDYKTSKSVLEEVALTYQRYSVGEQALRTLKEIAIEEGTVNAFARWVKDQQLDTFTDIELEKSAFNAAERQFLEGNTSAALKLLEEYKQTYPEGAFSKVATYYLAEIYFDKERPEEALVAYQSLLEDPQVSTYSEKALTRVIILLKNKNLEIEAIPYMEQLAVVASFEENKRFAMLNLMQAYYSNQQFKRALETAEAVLNLNEIEAVVEWDALKLKARSSMALGDSLNAADAYLKLEKAPQAAVVTEALYFRAERMHRENDFTTSNELIGKIAENSGQSGEWNVKALLLLAKNYYALSDAFQAVFVLETIIENFDSYPLIVEEAAELIEQYRASLGEENRSITKDTTNE